MKLKALIFDVDGTLANTENAHLQAFNMAFEQAGVGWYWDKALYNRLLAVTGGKERIRYYVQHFNGDFDSSQDLSTFAAQLHAQKTAIYVELMNNGQIPLRIGVENLFQAALDKGLKLAIATTTSPSNVTALLHSTLGKGSEKMFSVIAAGDMVKAKKPSADVFELALKQLKMTADECLAFEDSENGVHSATGAGLKTVITINEFTENHDFSKAALVLDQLGDEQHPFTIIDAKGMDLQGFRYFNLQLAEKIAHG